MKLLLANFSKMVGDTGGAAKVHCSFANEMKRRGHDVTMVFCDDKVGKPFFPVDDGIELYNLQHYEDTNVIFPTYLKVKREIIRAFSTRRGRALNNEFVKIPAYTDKVCLGEFQARYHYLLADTCQ